MPEYVVNGVVVYNESGESEDFAHEFGIELGGGRVRKPVFVTPKKIEQEAGKEGA